MEDNRGRINTRAKKLVSIFTPFVSHLETLVLQLILRSTTIIR